MPEAGKYDQRIAIMRLPASPAVDAFGQLAVTPATTVATLWAKVEPLTGNELYLARQNIPNVTHKISCRYYPAGIKAKDYIVFRGRNLALATPLETETRHVEIVVYAIEQTQ